jgi:hypothetical protein
MRYYLDTEFNEFGGELISLALVREDGKSIYLVYPTLKKYGDWVKENVVPILWDIPLPVAQLEAWKLLNNEEGARIIQEFLSGDPQPFIITDWPDDIRYFCQAIITGPGTMINIPGLVFQMFRIDAYPTTLEGAVQHNAWWDAMALREILKYK